MARAALLLALLAAALCAAAADTVNNQTVIDQSVFPTVRPPMWNFRTAANASYTCKKFPFTAGWTLTVNHALIPGVNSSMMAWMFRNMATASAASPIDGKTYPLFLLYHPRDHIRHSHLKVPNLPTFGTNTTWVEFPLTGCTRKGATFDWDCPSGPATPNPGFLRSTPVEQWAKQEQVNGTSRVVAMGPTSAAFATRACSSAGCADIIVTRHMWSQRAAKKGDANKCYLSVTSTLTVGINMADNDVRIVNGWANGLDPETKCHRTARHYIEEIGGTEFWLPSAFNAAGGKP